MKKFKSWFHDLSLIGRATFVSVLLILFIGVMGASAQPGGNTNVVPKATTSSATPIKATTKPSPKIEIKPVTTTETIPYTSSTINDSTVDQGVTKTQTKGVNGVLTHTYQVTYTNGTETSRSDPVDTITTPAINEVIVNGTKAPTPVSSPATDCPNGTYVNSAGNTVCSPYTSSSAPSGATAKCGDGSYSFSQSRSGTCSHHGGVATWL